MRLSLERDCPANCKGVKLFTIQTFFLKLIIATLYFEILTFRHLFFHLNLYVPIH